MAAPTGNLRAGVNSLVVDYVVEEVTRQGHDVAKLDGIERVGWMLGAWSYALHWFQYNARPSVHDAVRLAMLIEPGKNLQGLRTIKVWVGSRSCPEPTGIAVSLNQLFEHRASMTPLEFYKAFELIHPFVDGNGRTGKCLLNWLGGTLLAPVFPPADIFGFPIRNP